jgi:hypothetical protein
MTDFFEFGIFQPFLANLYLGNIYTGSWPSY